MGEEANLAMGQIFTILGLAAFVSHVAPRVFADDGRQQHAPSDDDEHHGRWRSTAHGGVPPLSRVVTDYLKCCCGGRVWWQGRQQLRGYPLFLEL
jgi:hypothetical protein